MPWPEFPVTMEARGVEDIAFGGAARRTQHWVEDIGEERTHVWVDADTGAPLRLTNEAVAADGAVTPLMTYELLYSRLGAPDDAHFALQQGWTHKTCERFLTGFPYIHAFHWYLRF